MTIFGSIQMPNANALNYIKGGRAWVTNDFDLSDDTTWTGIACDPDGSLLGAGHEGLTLWKVGVKRFQLTTDGQQMTYGNLAAWVPEGYDPLDSETWTGVVIKDDEINVYHEGDTRVHLGATDGIIVRHGYFICAAGAFDLANPSSWTGVLLNFEGIRSFQAGVQTFKLDVNGDILMGKTADTQIFFDESTGIVTVGKDIRFNRVGGYLIGDDLVNGAVRARAVIHADGYLINTTLVGSGGSALSTVVSNAATGAEWNYDTLPNASGTPTYDKDGIKRALAVIDATNNMALDSGKKLSIDCSGSYGQLEFGSIANIYGASSNIYCLPITSGSGTLNLGSATKQWAAIGYNIVTGGGHYFRTDNTVRFQITDSAISIGIAGGTTNISLNGRIATSIYPNDEGTLDLGQSVSALWWRSIFVGNVKCNDIVFQTYTDATDPVLSDEFDDLALISAIECMVDEKGDPILNEKGENIVNLATMPDHVLHIFDTDKTGTASIAEVKVILSDPKNPKYAEVRKGVGINLKSLQGLMIGSFRKLNAKVKEIEAWKAQSKM